jgi:hypothetical protein
VPITDLISGTNTIQFLPLNEPMDFPPVIANIDLLLSASGITPTSSPSASSLPSCAKASLGDIDCDNTIGIFDYNILVGNFNKSGTNIPGDLNGSGKVDIFDYNILVTNFGK